MANETKSSAEIAREQRKARIEKAGISQTAKKEKKASQSITKRRLKWIIPVVVVVLALLFSLLYFFGAPQRMFSAVKLDDGTKVSIAEFEYYYKYSALNMISTAAQYEQYGEGISLMYLGYDPTKTPGNQSYPIEQITDETDLATFKKAVGTEEPTWADYLKYSSIQEAQILNYAYANAKKAKLTLSDEYKDQIDELIESYREDAASNNYSLNAYLKNNFGRGMNEKLFRNILEKICMYEIYFDYAEDTYVDGITDEDINNYYKENSGEVEYCSIRYFETSFEPIVNKEDDTSTADVNEATNYTEDELAKMNEKAKAEAKANAKEFFDKANAKNFTTLSTKYCDKEYAESFAEASNTTLAGATKTDITTYYGEDAGNWAYDSSRKVGDKQFFEITEDDGCVTFVTLLITSLPQRDETVPSVVRHILIKEITEDDGQTDANGNAITRTLEQAKTEAQKILDQYNADVKAGKDPEEAFTALVADNTDDTGSAETGGLYDDITEDAGYVAPFKNWALSKDRKAGDVEIVEVTSEDSSGSYAGYHIMFYVGLSKHQVWQQSIIDILDSNYMNDLQNSIFNTDTKVFNHRIKKIQNRIEDYAAQSIAAASETTTVATDTSTVS